MDGLAVVCVRRNEHDKDAFEVYTRDGKTLLFTLYADYIYDLTGMPSGAFDPEYDDTWYVSLRSRFTTVEEQAFARSSRINAGSFANV